MKKTNLKLIILFAIIVVISSCYTNQYPDYSEDCEAYNCQTEEPYEAKLYISFTKNSENQNPQLLLLEGLYEDNNVIDTLDTQNATFNIDVLINHHYTVVAKYIKGSDTIIAIDAAYVEKQSYYECDYICWKVKDGNIDVKL